jgi:hypothetical protein
VGVGQFQTARPPKHHYMIWTMDIRKGTGGGCLKSWDDGGQHILIRMLDRGKVELMVRHWSSCEKVKGEFDGDHLVLTIPL